MVEEIESMGLELQRELVREVEPSAQGEISLVQRKASGAIPTYIVPPKVSEQES